jgi:hypothetical protein
MSNDNTRDAAEPSPASAGSQPVAWLAHSDQWEMLSLFREHADAAANEWNWSVEPLYRHPPFTLTDAEREAVERAVNFCECTTSPLPTSDQIATLRALLQRTRG